MWERKMHTTHSDLIAGLGVWAAIIGGLMLFL
jgi:hypothetical protein